MSEQTEPVHVLLLLCCCIVCPGLESGGLKCGKDSNYGHYKSLPDFTITDTWNYNIFLCQVSWKLAAL